jgi:hypothetical protein
MPGVDPADVGAVETPAHEEAAATGSASASSATPSTADGISALELRARLSAAAAGGPLTTAVGPEGIYDSTVDVPEGEVQREVVSFVTDRNPDGLKLAPGEGFTVPRALAADGVIGVRVHTAGGGYATASIGDIELAAWEGAQVAGRQPVHGAMRLGTYDPLTIERIEVFHKIPSASETTDYFPIHRDIKAGTTCDIPLSPHRHGRELDQIEMMWTAHYSVADPSGATSDEGKPMWLDGVYADVFTVDADGNETQVDYTKFVDEYEVDNIHDLYGVLGDTLRVKFFAKNPEGEDSEITFEGVRFRYKDEVDPATPPASFDLGQIYEPGEVAEIELPQELRGKRIGRVEVRWTDMLSGTWTRPGYAEGTLVIDGEELGRSETVQSPETQTFSYLGGAVSETGRVGVRITSDRARVDRITVHFDE